MRWIEVVRGTVFDDTFIGDDRYNYFEGLAGNDTIDGGAGYDLVSYAYDATYVAGSSGVTVNLQIGKARDGFGDIDTLISITDVRGTNFADVLIGNAASNIFEALAGNDTINGGAGDFDEISYLFDAFYGGTSGVTVDLQTGIATDGFGDTDTLTGIESVKGTNAGDRITGNAEINFFEGLGGDDIFDGGENLDVVSFAKDSSNGAMAGVTVNLATGKATDGFGDTDTLTNIEYIRGSESADMFSGNSEENYFEGLAGDDILHGGAGNDFLYGNAGADQLRAGAGLDRLFIDELDTAIDGGAGSQDRVIVQQLASATAGVTVDMAASNVEIAYGNRNDDTFDGSGSAVALSLYGRGGQDSLIGGAADDRLFGDGNDTSSGDILNGGAGNDYLHGGTNGASRWAERDRFVFGDDWGNDRIFDFADNGAEKIDFNTVAGITQRSDLTITDGAGFALISYHDAVGGWDASIRVDGVTATDLQDNDFIFV